MAKPKLALLPAAQGSKLYSVLPSSGVGDFDFTRSGSATRINSQGLIETVASGVSRLNYPMIDGVVKGCPHHILEPQRTQLFRYSEAFDNSYWTKINSSITSNVAISPDGTLNADKLVEDSTNGYHILDTGNMGSKSGSYTYSFFAKKGENNFVVLWWVYSNTSKTWFDLENGVVGSKTGAATDNAKIEDYGNGWFKCSVTRNEIGNVYCVIGNSNQDAVFSYQGDGTSGVYIWGAMLEEGSYPTSYIPNYGTAAGVTRSAETANGSGNAATFNDSEGVLMAEMSALADDGTVRSIALSDGTGVNRINIRFRSQSNEVEYSLFVNGETTKTITHSVSHTTNFHKMAALYKEDDLKFYVNGFLVGSFVSANMLPTNTLNQLNFDSGAGLSDLYGKTKQVQYYDTALTDNELETLTSWVSFTDMAEGQQYTIE